MLRVVDILESFEPMLALEPETCRFFLFNRPGCDSVLVCVCCLDGLLPDDEGVIGRCSYCSSRRVSPGSGLDDPGSESMRLGGGG